MFADLRHRLRSVLRRDDVEQQLDDELAFHRERLMERYVAGGLPTDEARRRARLEMGGFDQLQEEHRDARGVRFLEDLDSDLRHAVRQIKRSPGFAATAILCLGVGIGANTAVFSALNSVLLRPLSVAEPARLVMLSRGPSAYFSYPDFQDLKLRGRVLSGLAASFPMESDLEVDGASDFVTAEVVSANYGAVLGAAPALGRWFTSDTEPVAVISHAVWQSRFGGSEHVLGRSIGSETQSYTVVGVAPADFTGIFAPYRTDIWVPMRTRPQLAARLNDRSRALVMIFGHLGAGATPGQAAAELNGIATALVSEHGISATSSAPIVAELVRGIPSPGGRRLVSLAASLLMIVVSTILVIACVNVGHLLLARGSLRQREFAVRLALGASRSRLMRQLLTESLVLAIGGGASGVLFALWTTRLIERAMPSVHSVLPVDMDLSLDWRGLVYAMALSLATMLVCGLVPAWRGAQTVGAAGLRRDVAHVHRWRRPFGLVAQVMLSFALIVMAGTVIASLRQLQVTDPGFSVRGRLYAYIYFPSAPTPEIGRQLYAETLEHLRAMPGVVTASQTSTLPLMPSGTECASRAAGPRANVSTSAVGDGYFQTMGIRMIAGRDFASVDLTGTSSSIIITDSLAKRLFPIASPIGERVLIGCAAPQPAVVIGVVRDSAVRDVGEPPQPRLYRPFAQQYTGGITAVVLATSTDPASMLPATRQALLAMGRNIRVYAVEPLDRYVDRSFTGMRWMASVLSGFGVLALLLAAVGLYGVIAYRTSLRTREIGVRIALGADPRAIFREVVWRGLMIAVLGVAVGEALAAAAVRALGAVEMGIRPAALSVHLSAAVIWVTAASLACYRPASRASRIPPMEALRHE